MSYIKSLCVKETNLMKKIRDAVNKEDHSIYIEPEKGQFIKILLKLIKAKKILEVGTHYGYSTLWLLEGLMKGGHIDTIERSECRYVRAKEFLQDISEISLHFGAAEDVLQKLQGPYDAVFIDAEKLSYLKYLNWSQEKLRPGGLLIADDTLLFGALQGKKIDIRNTTLKVMQEFNAKLTKPPFESVILPYSDGLTIAIKN